MAINILLVRNNSSHTNSNYLSIIELLPDAITESLGDVFMEEMDAEPKQHAELLPEKDEAGQKEVVEEEVFFHPVEASEKGDVLVEEGIEESTVEIEQKLQELLRGISEETLQLREFLMEESKLVNELCVSIKLIMKKLNVSFDISPREIPVKKKVKRVILDEEGRLILFSEKGEVRSGFLAEYPPRIVMAVLYVVMPKLAKVVVVYTKKVRSRVSLFRKLKKELKSIAKAVVGGKEETVKAGGREG